MWNFMGGVCVCVCFVGGGFFFPLNGLLDIDVKL